MPTSITHSFSANVNGGPSFRGTNTVDYEAYEVVRVTVPGGSDAVVNLSADSGARLLAIMSNAYDDIKYKVGGDEGASNVILDGPHILIGKGIIALLGAAPGRLTFRNDAGDDATVTILVGRDAIEPTP